jgi:hypothetical protein
MSTSVITVIINDKPYRLSASDSASIAKLSAEEKNQLRELLQAVNQHEPTIERPVQKAIPKTQIKYNQPEPKPERLGRGDVESTMARLIMEEKSKQKPALTKRSVYKFIGGLALLAIVLILIF